LIFISYSKYIMGQDTYIELGINVQLKLEHKNAKLINMLLSKIKAGDNDVSFPYSYIILGMSKCSDELYNKNYDLDGFPFEIFEEKDKEVFDKKIASLNYKHQLTFIFFHTTAEGYVRNLSRRTNPHIFSDTGEMSVDEFIDKLNNGKKLFLDLGIPLDQIKVNITIRDD